MLQAILNYTTTKLNLFLFGVNNLGSLGWWNFLEATIWNICQFLFVSFALEKWLQLRKDQTLMGILLFIFWDTIGLTLFALYSVHKIMARSGIGIAGISIAGFNLFSSSSSGRTLGRAVADESMEDSKYNPKAEPGKEEEAVISEFTKMEENEESHYEDNNSVGTSDDNEFERENGNVASDGTNIDNSEEEEIGTETVDRGVQEDVDKHTSTDENSSALGSSSQLQVRASLSASGRRSTPNASSSTTNAAANLPPMKSSTQHPGLQGFHIWMGAITDIYRMYSIGKINPSSIEVYPSTPQSERGRAPVEMQIQNWTSMSIEVFWIDFKGNEKKRGTLRPTHGSLQITTWVGHPWIFREKRTGRMVLYYVPYRVIPVIASQVNGETKYNNDGNDDDDDDRVSKHVFAITPPSNDEDACGVKDTLMPYPPTRIQIVAHAIAFACQQIERENNPSTVTILLKYLRNILRYPSQAKYRQIRMGNKTFFHNVWCNGGRGVLEALGFQENGPMVEMGPRDGMFLPGDRVKDVSCAIVMLEELYKDMVEMSIPQPQGADGSGRGYYRSM